MTEDLMKELENSEREITEVKNRIKDRFQNIIIPGLVKKVRDIQGKLPINITEMEKSDVLLFRDYGQFSLLTKDGILDKTKNPYRNKMIEFLVNSYIYPSLMRYPDEHHPSIYGAKRLLIKLGDISEYYEKKLEKIRVQIP